LILMLLYHHVSHVCRSYRCDRPTMSPASPRLIPQSLTRN
jgi:hypothetical protein